MIRRPPRSTQGVSSAASDVYKRQVSTQSTWGLRRNSEEDQIIMFEKGPHVSFSNCALPYHLSGVIESPDKLVLMNPKKFIAQFNICLLYTSPSPRDLSTSRMPSSA
eukprot:TRINITY_DN15683_c0_g1_i4.p1 TRINITY_DN15683_c0_g1~~TRINITY_DN15683_c0_g1_i4.p1  ORF type:complete len:107 (-),score=28.22 TRINITY_DN15683_c0_g1_i4:69-389(-)